jgi:hypothetical protein
MKKLKDIYKTIESQEFNTKIMIYLASKVAGDDYDPVENNLRDSMLSPKSIKGYVRDISPEALVWKQYGLSNIGAKEIICRKSYRILFEKAARIVIEGNDYQVHKGTGNKMTITERPGQLLRVTVTRLE